MPGRNFLFVPGPTNVPDRVLNAMHRAMEDHRSSVFPKLPLSIFPDLKKIFRTTEGQPFVFAATGTGMWEAALVNTCSPGDKVLATRYGQFSHLFIDCAQRLGLQVDIIDIPWGEGASPEKIEEKLRADTKHEYKGVLVVHNETATGVTSNIPAVRKAIDNANHPALLYVDGVSSIGCLEFRMDDWGVDLAITGSQKGFMLPAGLGLIAVSKKALARSESAKLPRVFFDFGDQIKANATGYFPYTPALTLLYGLREALDMLLEEGLENVYARHHRLAEGTRAAVKAWGLQLCAKEAKWNSDTVSAIMTPAGVDGAQIISNAFKKYNLALGAGLGQMAGKLFRIGHLGDLNELMLLGAIAGAEMSMRDNGMSQIVPGSGVGAASEFWRTGGTSASSAPAAKSAEKRGEPAVAAR